MPYQVVMSENALKAARDYKQQLINKQATAGHYLTQQLSGKDLRVMTDQDFITCLMQTRKPQIFAESAVAIDGSDWNSQESALLGAMSVSMNAQAFNDGAFAGQQNQEQSIRLIYTAGPLLQVQYDRKGDKVKRSPDYSKAVKDGKIDQEAYNALIEDRLFPALLDASNAALAANKSSVFVIPGLGCGQFGGAFGDEGDRTIKSNLNVAIQACLAKHAAQLKGLAGVVFDGYTGTPNTTATIGHIKYAANANSAQGRPLMSQSSVFATELGLPPSDPITLSRLVAWDHFSFPGNDYWSSNNRATDDGVCGGSTDTCSIITGQPGHYDGARKLYLSDQGPDWGQVARMKSILMKADRCLIVNSDGEIQQLVGNNLQSPSPEPISASMSAVPSPSGPSPSAPSPSASSTSSPLGERSFSRSDHKPMPHASSSNILPPNDFTILAVPMSSGDRQSLGGLLITAGSNVANKIKEIDPEGKFFQANSGDKFTIVHSNFFLLPQDKKSEAFGFYTSSNGEPSIKLPASQPKIVNFFTSLMNDTEIVTTSQDIFDNAKAARQPQILRDNMSFYFCNLRLAQQYSASPPLSSSTELASAPSPSSSPFSGSSPSAPSPSASSHVHSSASSSSSVPAPSLTAAVSLPPLQPGQVRIQSDANGMLTIEVDPETANEIRQAQQGMAQPLFIERAPGAFDIKPSTGREDFGCYLSQNGEPAVALPRTPEYAAINELFKQFTSEPLVGAQQDFDAFTASGANTIYTPQEPGHVNPFAFYFSPVFKERSITLPAIRKPQDCTDFTIDFKAANGPTLKASPELSHYIKSVDPAGSLFGQTERPNEFTSAIPVN